ncbi:helix-turn-helix transcriptional regulator [Acinetobacter bereziniae]|uniref:helix-turn-helix domain-containing protein n=1 Tax=Acinetobacter bereziniae TaxID=106648 RepID=UPI002FDA225C
MHVFKKISPDSDAVEFDAVATHNNQKKIFFTSAEHIFGFLLLLFRKNLGLNQEEMGAVLINGQKLSKTGYAKLERAETRINIQILFDLSCLTQINFSHIFTIYNHLLHTIGESKCEVGFSEMLGHYGIGNISSQTIFKKIGSIKSTYSAKYESYIDVIGQQNIDLINNTINHHINDAVRDHIKRRADAIINANMYRNLNTIQTSLVDHEAVALLKEQYDKEPEWVRKKYSFDRYDELISMGVDLHTTVIMNLQYD